MDKPITVTLELPAEIMKRFEERAQEERRPLVDLLRERLVSTFDGDDEMEDTPDEEILADLRQSLEEFRTGQTRPIEELFDEIRESRKHDR